MTNKPGRKLAALGVAALVGLSGPQAMAAGLNDLQEFHTLTGTCTALRIGSEDYSRGCLPKVLNSVYRTGRSGFTFTVGDIAVVTISGAGENVRPNRTEIVQPVDRLIVSLLGTGLPPNSSAAVGTCSFGDAYSGRAVIKCAGRTDKGPFTATFVTDGKPPRTKSFAK